MLTVNVAAQSFKVAGNFTISRGSKTSAEVIVVEISANGATGRGEAVPYRHYGETVEGCIAAIDSIKDKLAAGLTRDELGQLALPKAAQNAVDCALLDIEAKRAGKPAWELARLAAPKPLLTAFTLSLDTPENMGRAARNASAYPLLKLKLGRDGDADRLAAIRAAAPNARLIVDANEGWLPANLQHILDVCESNGVELVEQPLPSGNDKALRHVARRVLICADESAHGVESLSGLVGKYDAINIKLDKTGGLTPALAVAAAARKQDFKIMVGCMLASSLAIAPAFLLAQAADYVDLDGPLLLAQDRKPGFKYLGGWMQPPSSALWG